MLKYAGGVLDVKKRFILGSSISGVKTAIDQALVNHSKIHQLLIQLNKDALVNQKSCDPANNPGTLGDLPCDPIYTSSYELYQETTP
jgi:hypothetical protein